MAKEFKTIAELIDLLESRNVKTDDDTKAQLMRESYYAIINGYKNPFLDKKTMANRADDVYLEGTQFRWIYALFSFDRDLRAITFKYLARAESVMKNAVVYAFCEANPEPNAYLSTASYASSNEMLFTKRFKGNRARIYQRNMTRLMGVLNSKAGGGDGKPFIVHYLDRYGFVPLWVLENDLTFGHMSHFYQLQKRSVQNSACKIIATLTEGDGRITPQQLLHAFSVLVDFRNLCAHDERLYCAKVGRSHDLGFDSMVEALTLVLPFGEVEDFLKEVMDLFETYAFNLNAVTPLDLWREMGFSASGEKPTA